MSRIAASHRALALLSLLGVLLGASAPLAHAHLEAGEVAASGLCGEHHADDAPEGEETCSLCLAGAQARTALRAAGLVPAPAPLPAAPAAAFGVERPPEPRLAATRSRAPPRV